MRRGKALVFSSAGAESLSRGTVDRILAETRDERINPAGLSDGLWKTALPAQWVMEALESGPAKPLRESHLKAAFQKGIGRAKGRRSAK